MLPRVILVLKANVALAAYHLDHQYVSSSVDSIYRTVLVVSRYSVVILLADTIAVEFQRTAPTV